MVAKKQGAKTADSGFTSVGIERETYRIIAHQCVDSGRAIRDVVNDMLKRAVKAKERKEGVNA
jgi:hypothetical protein